MARPIGPKKVQRYSLEFKLKAVKLSQVPGVGVQAVAEALEIHPFMLSRWRKEARDGRLRGRVSVPKAPPWEHHLVVIPKQHVRNLVDVEDPALLAELFQAVIAVIRHKGFGASNFKVITNGGSYQSNQHLHIHIVSGRPLDPDGSAAKGELAV